MNGVTATLVLVSGPASTAAGRLTDGVLHPQHDGYPRGNDSAETLMLHDALSFEDVFPYVMLAFAVVEYALMALMVLGNMFIIISYFVVSLRGSKNSLNLSSSGRLVLNLVLADMLVGLGLCYFSAFKFWPSLAAILARYRVPCVLRFSLCFLTMFGSHCALLVVSLDRYTAIAHTLHYKELVTTRTSWLLIAGGWAVPLAGSSALFFVNQWRPDVPACDEHHIVPKFLLWFALPSNVFVLLAISVAHWRVHREVKAFTLRRTDPDFVHFVTSAAARRSQGCRKSVRVLLRVTTTFLVCWTPLDAMLVLFVVVGPEPWLLAMFECTFLLAMTSFLLNPMVYAWQTEAIRRPVATALVALGVLRPSALAPQGAKAKGPQGRPPLAAKSTGVFAMTTARDSVLSLSQSSSSAHTTETTQSSLA